MLICSDPVTGATVALALVQPSVLAATMAPATSKLAQALAGALRVTFRELLSTRRGRQAPAQAATQAMTVATQDLAVATI